MSDGCSLTHPGPVCSAGGGIRSAATPRTAAVPDPADVEKVARELYRQWREDSGGDPADLPDWEFLNEDCDDEDEPDPRGAYRRRAVLVLTAVRPSPDSEANRLRAAMRDLADQWEQQGTRVLAYRNAAASIQHRIRAAAAPSPATTTSEGNER